MSGPAHGAWLRHPVPPPGPPGAVQGTPAEDRPAPSPRQAVHRSIAPPAVAGHAVGDAPAGFSRHTARRERAERWRGRLHVAGIAAALVAALAAAVALGHATAGPIRPHVAASTGAPR